MKNKKRQMALGRIGAGIITSIVAALALAGCEQPTDSGKKDPGPQNNFTIPVTETGFAKPVIINDMRDDETIKRDGNLYNLNGINVISRIVTGLISAVEAGDGGVGRINEVINNRGIIIVVETAGYLYFHKYSGNKLGINLAHISSNTIDMYELADGLNGWICYNLFSDQTLGKAIQTHDNGYQKMTGASVRMANAAARMICNDGSHSKPLVYSYT